MINVKKNKAITLIALVITIVVLIILAAVAINLSLGNNGIFNRAKTAKEQYQNAENYEQTEIAKSANKIDNYVGGNRGTITLTQEEYEKLIKKGTWELLATSTSTTFSEYTVKDLKQYSQYVLVIYNYVHDLVASTIINYDAFTTIADSHNLYANYYNGTPYVGYAKYINDTKIKMAVLDSYTSEVRFYGIY